MKPLATFDFDDTLTTPVWSKDFGSWGKANGAPRPNEKNLERLRALSTTHDIRIVTSRHDTQLEEIRWFVDLWKLPVVGVHATNGADKVHLLMAFESVLHFDDDSHELSRIKEDLPTCKVVHVPMPDGTFF